MVKFSVRRTWGFGRNSYEAWHPPGGYPGQTYPVHVGQGGAGGGGGSSTEVVDADSLHFKDGFLLLKKDGEIVRAMTATPGLEVKRLG